MRNAVLAIMLAAALPLAAQNLTNAHVTPVRASADLGAQVRGANGWIGYSVPGAGKLHGKGRRLCSAGRGSRRILPEGWSAEAARDAMILYRVAGGTVERIHVYSSACSVDGAGLSVAWIENVDPK